MRRLALCVALVGCNQVFDIDPTELASEAPAACPPLGTAPRFDTTVRQAIRVNCTGYTESADTKMAMALCQTPDGKTGPHYGPADGPLAPIALTTPLPPEAFFWPPVLAPEGDEAFWVANDAGQIRMATFSLDGDTWSFAGYAPTPTTAPITDASPPSRRPHPHVVYFLNSQLHEAVRDDAGAWAEVGAPYDTYPVNANRPYLSPDGLRLVSTVIQTNAQHVVMYADRPSLDARFGTPTTLDNVPPTSDTFVREDCGRVYFSGLSNVLYEEEQR